MAICSTCPHGCSLAAGKRGACRSRRASESHVEPEGYGRRYPVQSNLDDQGRFQNRRVEIEVLNIGMRITGDDKEAEK